MSVFFHWAQATPRIWQEAMAERSIGSIYLDSNMPGDAGEVEYAVVWAPPGGLLKTFPNLKYIFSIGAGVTHITEDPDYPAHVPIVRLQDELLVLDMSCHIIHWVLHFHRHYARYKSYQSEKKWQRHRYPENAEKRVAIMGLGQTGLDACARLRDLDFTVTGWARSPKKIEGVKCLHGDDQFANLLEEADILVNLLPLTADTTDILDAAAFSKMPEGAFLINCGRGSSIKDADLLAALDSGRIEAAALDVFREEPLPDDSPYWTHPAVSVTPHAAAPTNERSAARFIADQIRKCMDGGLPAPIVDPARGY